MDSNIISVMPALSGDDLPPDSVLVVAARVRMVFYFNNIRPDVLNGFCCYLYALKCYLCYCLQQDSMTLFSDLSYGAESVLSTIVVMNAIMKTVNDFLVSHNISAGSKRVIFALFAGVGSLFLSV